jgi:hypothetical protein
MCQTRIVFYELHPINILPILILSIFFKIAYWRSVFLPKWLIAKFEQIFHYESFTEGEWAVKNAYIFFDLKKKFPKEKYIKRVFFQYDGKSIDVTKAAMQSIASKYERVSHFYLLINYWLSKQPTGAKYFVVDFLEDKNLNDVDLSVRDDKYSRIYLLNTYLDMLWGELLNILQLGKCIKSYFLPTISPKYNYSKEKIKLYWYGLSFNEIASSKNSLDVTAIIRKGLEAPSKSLLILPTIPDNKQKTWFLKNDIKWIYQGDVCKFSFKKNSLKNIFKVLKIAIGFRSLSGERVLIRQIKAPLISYSMILGHFLETGASTLVTGQSYGLQENPIVSVVRALHKKTIWWSYAGLGANYYPGLKLDNFLFEQIDEVITLSEEKCVWSGLDKGTLIARDLTPIQEEKAKFIVTGPLMSGETKWIKLRSGQARKKYKEFNDDEQYKLWITIFDLPVDDPSIYIKHRCPFTTITKEFELSFFRDVELILEKYQNVGIIYKPKRRVAEKFFESDYKKKLFSKDNPLFSSGRIVKLPYNIDPYMAISMGDVAIAMPYTSALIASISFKRDGIYYDPLANLGSAYPELFNSITLNSFEQLCDRVESWLMGENFINNDAFEVLKYKGDPVTNFTSLL